MKNPGGSVFLFLFSFVRQHYHYDHYLHFIIFIPNRFHYVILAIIIIQYIFFHPGYVVSNPLSLEDDSLIPCCNLDKRMFICVCVCVLKF